jgi:hypothetical protein
MKRFCEMLRILLVSPETVIVLLVIMGMIYWPTPFIFVGEKFLSTEKLWEYIPVIPLGVLTFAVYLSIQLQAPVANANRELYDWEMYWALKYRIVAILFWTSLSALCSLSIWLLSNHLPIAIVGSLFIGSIAVSLAAVATGILALFMLKEILTK